MAAQCPECGTELIDVAGVGLACPSCALVPASPATGESPIAPEPPPRLDFGPPEPAHLAPPYAPAPEPRPEPLPLPSPAWVIAASIGASVALLLAAVVAWRLSDSSLLPTVESLGGPDNVESAVPLPPPPAVPEPEPAGSGQEADEEVAVEIPTEIEPEALDSAEVPASASAPGSASAPASPTANPAKLQ